MDHETMNLWDDPAVVQAYCEASLGLSKRIVKWKGFHVVFRRESLEMHKAFLTIAYAFEQLWKRYARSQKRVAELSEELAFRKERDEKHNGDKCIVLTGSMLGGFSALDRMRLDSLFAKRDKGGKKEG